MMKLADLFEPEAPEGCCGNCRSVLGRDRRCLRCAIGPALSQGVAPAGCRAGRFRSEEIPSWLGRLKNYEILEEVGRGGMGVVYRARQRGVDRQVAIKTMLESAALDAGARAQFSAEARALACLRHEGIVTLFEFGDDPGLPFFSMEYVEGPDLAALLQDGELPWREAARYIEAIARAISHAHGRGIVHGDLTPSNIVLDASSGLPRVIDFGLSRSCRFESKRIPIVESLTNRRATIDHEVPLPGGREFGTPGFAPPELARCEVRRIGPASDIYSLGALLFFLLTSRPPVSGKTGADTLRSVERGYHALLGGLAPGVPGEIARVCSRCLRTNPEERYASAGEVSELLGRLSRGSREEASLALASPHM